MNGNTIAGNWSIDAGRDMEWAHVSGGGFAIWGCWCGGGTAYGRNQAYGSHSVAVMGYESYPGGNYVVVQDTWTPLTAVSLSYGNWASAVADYSRPD